VVPVCTSLRLSLTLPSRATRITPSRFPRHRLPTAAAWHLHCHLRAQVQVQAQAPGLVLAGVAEAVLAASLRPAQRGSPSTSNGCRGCCKWWVAVKLGCVRRAAAAETLLWL